MSFYINAIPILKTDFRHRPFDLIDKKAKKYVKKEFYENGRVKEEGTMYFRKDVGDYQKEGAWTYYDEKGTAIKTEKYHSGQLE